MSAITHISAHADYHRSDYMFSRTQSRTLNEREWEDRLPGLRSWGSMLVPAIAASVAMAAALMALA